MNALIILVIIGWLIPFLSKAAQRRAATAGTPVAQNAPQRPVRATRTAPPEPPAAPESRAAPDRLETRLASRLEEFRFTEGAPLSPRYGEGTDPCHPQEPLAATDNSAVERSARTPDIPGLELEWDADSLVKGVIYSEILTRKQIGRQR